MSPEAPSDVLSEPSLDCLPTASTLCIFLYSQVSPGVRLTSVVHCSFRLQGLPLDPVAPGRNEELQESLGWRSGSWNRSADIHRGVHLRWEEHVLINPTQTPPGLGWLGSWDRSGSPRSLYGSATRLAKQQQKKPIMNPPMFIADAWGDSSVSK